MSDSVSKFIERTLVIIKPDGVMRGLVGDITHRFERAGLKIVAMKMIWVDKDRVAKHYPNDREDFIRGMGEKSLTTYEKYGLDAMDLLGTTDPLEIGKMINEWNRSYMAEGPVVAIVLEGIHAVENVRLMAGNTMPTAAVPGTIRGDLSVDSPSIANSRKRAIKNLVHASGNLAEAAFEIDLWFKPEELHGYKRADEDVMFQ